MARQQWQQVAAPNFTPSLEALNVSNQMTNAGLDNLQKTIAGFDATNTAGANQEVLLRAMGFTDRDALQRSITDRSLFAGYNPKNITADTLGSIGSRQAALLSRATGEESLGQTQYNNRRTREGNAATDAAAPTLARMQTAAAGYDPALGNLLATLSPQEATTAIKNLQGIQGTNTSNKSNLFTYRTTVRNDQESRAADAAVADLDRSATDPTTAGEIVRAANLNPSVEALVRKRAAAPIDLLGVTGGSSYGNSASAASTSAPGTAGTRQGSRYDVTYGFTPTVDPITAKSIGEVGNIQTELIRSKGNSPIGAYQINKATLEEYAPKVLGADWKNQQFTPEVQEKIAESIYNARRKGELHKTWAALPPSPAGVYANVPWSEMRDRISEAELKMPASESAAQSLRAIAGDASRKGATTVNENIQAQGAVQVGSNPDRLLKAATENISKNEAIKRGSETLPLGKVQLDRMLEQGRAKGVPYSATLELLSNATVPTAWGSFFDAVTPFDFNGQKIDEKKFLAGLENYAKPNGTLAQADTAYRLRTAQESTKVSQEAVASAAQNLMNLQRAKERNPAIPDSAIQRQAEALASAQAALDSAGQRTEQLKKELIDITPVGTSAGKPQAVTPADKSTAVPNQNSNFYSDEAIKNRAEKQKQYDSAAAAEEEVRKRKEAYEARKLAERRQLAAQFEAMRR